MIANGTLVTVTSQYSVFKKMTGIVKSTYPTRDGFLDRVVVFSDWAFAPTKRVAFSEKELEPVR